MLTDIQQKLWDVYARAEGRAPRAEKLRALETFLDALRDTPEADWFPWARSIAEQVVDHGVPMVLRRPLFERAVFPALLEGYRARLPGCARWMAGLADNLQRSPECRKALDAGEAPQISLLRSALEDDPADRWSLLRLIETIASRLRYALHELPAGVLYGIDGATPEQCLELEAELDEFRGLVARARLEQRYAQLMAKCQHHFRAYRQYLLHGEPYASYAEFLDN